MFLRIASKMVMRLWHLRTAARLFYKQEKGLCPWLILRLPADRGASLTDVTHAHVPSLVPCVGTSIPGSHGQLSALSAYANLLSGWLRPTMPAHCRQQVCVLKTVRFCYASSRLRRCAGGVAALAGERTGLHGLDALPGTRPWGAVSLRPLAALGQMAFYCALTSFERPSIDAPLEGHLPDRGRGRGTVVPPRTGRCRGTSHLAVCPVRGSP